MTDQREHARITEARFENRQAVFDALRQADRPLTRRELALEALLSKKQVLRTLDNLEELGQVEQVPNPDDGRKPRYRLASMCPAGPGRQRASAHPAALGGLTVLVGLLFVVSVAIANGVIVG